MVGQEAKGVKAGALCSHLKVASGFPNGLEEVIYLFHAQMIVSKHIMENKHVNYTLFIHNNIYPFLDSVAFQYW